MRIKKKELLEMIDQLIEINTLIDKDGRFPEGVDAPECQELALKLGNFIEDKYKESNPEDIIHSLEDYCELIYQMSLTENEEQTKLHKLVKKVKVVLLSARHGIEYDLPKDRKQVVFLPYKVSMWDSLESIWMAAHRDPEVDDYVIPIPYFDRNPDGTFAEMHYEGDQYPDYVPVTNWQEYSISDEKPEVIFIHNPYDNTNYVTSVHPSSYSSELKKWTDELVYIPYFVLGEIDPSNQTAIDGMKHFITTPGVIYADKIIVQSEDMKKIYVNEFLKFAKEMGLSGEYVDRKYQEARILGTGSPKFDRLKRISKEDIIPEKWRKYIFKADGSRKKVILYNSSVTALLENNEKMIEKMKKVLQTFKESKDEVTLLWRPHPLIQATLTSMRPSLWNVYKEIVDKYREEDWGIYDDGPDLDRAIVVSDAYYGDWSSVVQLYRQVKKPVMIQSVNV